MSLRVTAETPTALTVYGTFGDLVSEALNFILHSAASSISSDYELQYLQFGPTDASATLIANTSEQLDVDDFKENQYSGKVTLQISMDTITANVNGYENQFGTDESFGTIAEWIKETIMTPEPMPPPQD